ncbi:hypothetical protein NDU88_010636 [Pleurodeles waltl]|uniref:Uncharacterized protein n=1 Tax=Pleurodeles waltl TaxID=8319 RepID=A0AAV7PZA7_PLEWA|nr:hypothetical protein NDU88_010636 [Pleurodeles waltl]
MCRPYRYSCVRASCARCGSLKKGEERKPIPKSFRHVLTKKCKNERQTANSSRRVRMCSLYCRNKRRTAIWRPP